MGHDEAEWFVDTKGYRAYLLLNGDRSRVELVRDALARHGFSTGSIGRSRYRANDGNQYDWFLTLSTNPTPVQLQHLRDVIGEAVAERGGGICGNTVEPDDAVEADDDAEEEAPSTRSVKVRCPRPTALPDKELQQIHNSARSLVVCRSVYDSGRLRERWDAIVTSVPDWIERQMLPCYRVVGWRVTIYDEDGKLRARGSANTKQQRHGEWRIKNDETSNGFVGAPRA